VCPRPQRGCNNIVLLEVGESRARAHVCVCVCVCVCHTSSDARPVIKALPPSSYPKRFKHTL